MIDWFQTRMIFPGADTQGRKEAKIPASALGPGMELVHLHTISYARVTGIFARAVPASPAAPTALYFYGNGMCLADLFDQIPFFQRLGINVLAMEYEGYGMSQGSAGEDACYRTADAGFSYLLSSNEVDPNKIVAMGWSLGGAVAIDLAHKAQEQIAAVVALAAFTSMGDVARLHYPYLPTKMLLRHHFQSEEKLRAIKVPVLLGHGDADEIVPISMHRRLAAAAREGGCAVSELLVPGAGHNDFFDKGEEEIAQALGDFFRQL